MMGLNGMIINPSFTKTAVMFVATRGLGKMYTTEIGVKILTTLSRMAETDPRLPKIISRMATLGYFEKKERKSSAEMSTRRIQGPDKSAGILGAVKDVQP